MVHNISIDQSSAATILLHYLKTKLEIWTKSNPAVKVALATKSLFGSYNTEYCRATVDFNYLEKWVWL